MGWYGRPIAKMKYSGVNFGFDYETGWMLPLESYKTRPPGKEPMFLRSFLPNWVEGGRSNDKAANIAMVKFFQEQQLFLSNIAIVQDIGRLRDIKNNHLYGRLRDFTSDDGVFTGGQGDIRVMTRNEEADITAYAKEKQLTQISGAQTKISMYLSQEGDLSSVAHQPATHIVKYAGFGQDPFRARGAAEWVGMTLARAGGVNCAEFALIEMPSEGGTTLNYLTERFDIPTSHEDERLIFCEELGAALGAHPAKTDLMTLNEVIDGVKNFSSNKLRDFNDLFKQVAANCILENGDFHARNLSLIKVASPTLDGFRSVRLSPAYDVMRTRDFSRTPTVPGERDEMRLCFEDAQGDYIQFNEPTIAQFVVVGKAMELTAIQSEKMLFNVASGMLDVAREIHSKQPKVFDRHEPARIHVIETCHAVIKNVLDMFPELKKTEDLEREIDESESIPVSRSSRTSPGWR